jgi:hemolysin III
MTAALAPDRPMDHHTQRPQTLREELANTLSHGLGFLLALASLPVLVSIAAQRGGAASVVGACVFSVTMMLLYGASALYHALPPGRAKRIANRLDHAAIYVFIAGSYTPFALGPLHGGWGWSLFGVVWGLATLGVLLKLLNRLRHPLWSTGLYVAMGWLALVAAVPMLERIATGGIVLLLAGGAAYTVGVVFFLLDNRVRYSHFVWHLFVLVGSACHFTAVLQHAPSL